MRALVSLMILGFVAGCADRQNTAKMTAFEKLLAEHTATITELKSEIESIKIQRNTDEFMRDIDEVAYLTPGSDGYATITMDLGRVTVQLENIEPYASGSRVRLRFGNLTSAGINGAKAKIEWGSVDEKGSPKNEEARSREVTFTESLRAGSWTIVPIVLDAVPPTALGFVRLRDVTHTGISLSR
jgi:hypothetical protein